MAKEQYKYIKVKGEIIILWDMDKLSEKETELVPQLTRELIGKLESDERISKLSFTHRSTEKKPKQTPEQYMEEK